MTTQEEQKKKIIAAFSTLGLSALVLLIMMLAAAWRVPGPPADEMGIEVNLGYDNVGSGDIQPDAPVGNDQPQPAEEQTSQPQSAPQEANNAVDEETTKPVAEAKPVEPEPVATSDAESPVEINEKKKKEVKAVEKAPEKTKEKPVEAKEEKKEPVKEVKKDPVPDKNAAYKPGGTTTAKTGGDASGKEGKPGNHGDDPGTVGDKGNPEGKPDAKALYGKPGGGDGGSGPALDLYGWEWDEIPKPAISNNETGGKIVFEIDVDDNGELLAYRKVSGGLSAGAERACVAALQKLTFTKKSGAKVPPVSKGKITFVVRSE